MSHNIGPTNNVKPKHLYISTTYIFKCLNGERNSVFFCITKSPQVVRPWLRLKCRRRNLQAGVIIAAHKMHKAGASVFPDVSGQCVI